MTRQENLDYHLARLLIILKHFGSRRPLNGLTKLAKIDFLLRYPSFTERLLSSRELTWPTGAEPTNNEREAVESRMIRYKYGPWDDRYYTLLGALVGLGLAKVDQKGRSLKIQLTDEGKERAAEISKEKTWNIVDLRASMLRKSFDTTGNKLKQMIYEELPDVVDRPQRSEI
jgi:hypothetical protein